MKIEDINPHIQKIIKKTTIKLIESKKITSSKRKDGVVVFNSLRTIVDVIKRDYGISINTKHVSVFFKSHDKNYHKTLRHNGKARTGFLLSNDFINVEVKEKGEDNE